MADSPSMRFRLLETTRDFARIKLAIAQSDAGLRERHLAHYLSLAEKAAPELTGPHQAEWLACLETEHENLRAALAYALSVSGQLPVVGGKKEGAEEVSLTDTGHRALATEQGVRLAVALGRFWYSHSWYSEGREIIALGIRKNPNRTCNEQGHALHWAGVLAYMQGDHDEARRLSGECLTIFRGTGDRKGEAAALNVLGLVALEQGDHGEARQIYEESLAIQRELGHKQGISALLTNLGILTYEQGDNQAARRLYEESLALSRELGDQRGIALSLVNLGLLARNEGDYEEARRLQLESLDIHREVGDKGGIALSLGNLGGVAEEQGNCGEARRLLTEALALRRELGDKRGIAHALTGLGHVASREGKAARAARLLGAVGALREAIRAPIAPPDRVKYDRTIATAKAAIGEEAFDRAYAEGRAMTLDAAIEYAMDQSRDSRPATRDPGE